MLLSTAAAAMLVPASAAVDVWDGTIADSYAGGTGAVDNPYLISNGAQFALMISEGDNSKEKYYEITGDIYLNNTSDSSWKENSPRQWYSYTTIGKKYFQGTLNGAGHFIRGLYYNGSDDSVGLIPAAKGTVTVKDIQIADSYIESSGYALASVIGYAGGGNLNARKCYIHESVTVKCTNATADNAAGGIFGYGTGTYNISDCAVLSTRTSVGVADKVFTGAMVANTWSSTVNVKNSFARGVFGKHPGAALSADNCYTDETDDVYNTDVCESDKMKGESAQTNMSKLDWENIWTVTADGYPVFSNINIDGVKGEVWQGKVASGYAGGSGTVTDPYIIETANQLAYMIKHDVIDTAANNASYSMGKHYKLAADIYLNDVSDPDWMKKSPNPWYATTSGQRFGGNLDGNGYTIYGLYYEGDNSVGLISYADIYSYDITIKNVIISDAYLKTTAAFVGSLIGYVYGTNSSGRTLTVSGCFVNDNVLVYSSYSSAYIGGLVGCLRSNAANTYNFIGCGSLADVRHGGGDWKCYAGLVGPAGDGNFNIDNCFAFPNLAIYYGGAAVSSSNSYSLGTQASLLTILGDKAKETMTGFNWADGAFAPTKEGYPRLKRVSQRLGDINGDDKSNSEDIIILKKHFMGVETSFVADINSDGEQDIRDLVNLKKKTAAFTEDNGFVPEGYDLVWKDEFYGRTIDNEKWRTNQPRMSGTDELGNFDDSTVRSVNNGGLTMTAYKNPDLSGYNGKQYITTNSITTENRMSFRYGYLEVKAKVPYKEGCWPSLWLRSPNATQTSDTGADGYSMEVDIIEPFGYTDQNGTTIHETGTGDNASYHNQSAVGNYTFQNAENLADEYHVYGFLWTENEMKFYIDGKCFATYTKATLERLGYQSSFDDTVNILFNNHLFTKSSEFTGNSKDNIIENYEENLPSEFVVEYVRLYQQQNSGSVLVLETPAEGQ